MARVAIYGGAFDPPHLAHLFTVTWLLGLRDVDEVWLVPTADHVFGKSMTPLETRARWLAAALAPFDPRRVRLCLIEADLPAPSRTFDTLEALEARHPEHAFRLTIGADNLAERHRWHRFDELVARWPVYAVGRPGAEGALEAAVEEGWCQPGPRLPAISSTEVRAAAAAGDGEALRWLPGALAEEVVARFTTSNAADARAVLVLGHGKAGAALAAGLRGAGHPVATWDRRPSRGADSGGDVATLGPLLSSHPIWILAVRDEGVGPLAAALAAIWDPPPDAPVPVALHLAGRLEAEVMAPLAARGVRTGGLHPLQSLAGAASAGRLRGATFAVEGVAVDEAWALALALGGLPVRVPGGGKAAYHAAAVLAGNFTTILGAGGVRLLVALGIDEPQARRMLTPLMRGTVEQLARTPATEALTGPLARGDLAAVAAHRAAIIARAPEFLPVYIALARAAATTLGWDAPRRAALEAALGPEG